MSDVLSILTHSTKRLAKLWKADGSVSNYDQAKYFKLRNHEVGSLADLSLLLSSLEHDTSSCIIRGRYVGEGGHGRVLRQLEVFADQPLHTVLIEVDNFEPLTADPVAAPEECALEYVYSCLPPEFHGVSFHWQLSNSAGFPGKEHLLKAHLWFWLKDPATSAALRSWARASGVACDKAVFNPVQIHYTSAPVFEAGVRNPVPARSGLFSGYLSDEVPLVIAPVDTSERKVKIRGQNLGLHDETVPFLDILGDGEDGRLYITCPFKGGHSMESGPTETAYFPKGTGGFEQGHFKCMHDSCSGRKDEDFLDALGVRIADLEGIVVPKEEVEEEHPLPRFRRDKKGAILATADNVQMALCRSDVCGWRLRLDDFKDDVMLAPHGTSLEWRAMADVDYFALKLRLEKGGFKPISREMMRDAVAYVASLNIFDSAIEWLTSLKWDGVPRIDSYLQEYFSAEDSPYIRSVSSYMWTALAGRVMEPGVKADMVPVLIGAQGEGKSFGLESMVPSEDFYTSINLMARDADQARCMRGRLVIEIGELRGLHSRDMESIKDFITRRYETWIPKYKEFSKNYPRRSIFIGTSNQIEFLADTTGNRRWLPVLCGKVKVARIKADRAQLWAEARDRFELLGVDWQGAQRLAEGVHETHRMTDSWADQIDSWLHLPGVGEPAPVDLPYLQMNDIFREAFGMDIKNVKRTDEQRVAGVLRERGYEKKFERVRT
jgi:hypothetical protein